MLNRFWITFSNHSDAQHALAPQAGVLVEHVLRLVMLERGAEEVLAFLRPAVHREASLQADASAKRGRRCSVSLKDRPERDRSRSRGGSADAAPSSPYPAQVRWKPLTKPGELPQRVWSHIPNKQLGKHGNPMYDLWLSGDQARALAALFLR